MEGSRLPWIIVAMLILLAAFFAVAETALSAASRPRLKVMAENGNAGAKKALSILNQFERAITTILIGTNIVHIAAASIVTVEVTRRWGLSAVTLSTILTTIVVFFAGEMLPKSIAKKYAEPLAAACSGPLSFFITVFYPLASVLTAIGLRISRTVKTEPELSVTENELYDIIEDMTEDGKLDEEQGDLISAAIEFNEVTVESILTPRVDLVAVDVEKPLSEVLAVVRSCNHSRLPVYEGSIDNVIGILQIRRFMKAYLHEGDSLTIRPLLDQPFFVHQSSKIEELLPVMSKQKQNIAVVTDNYGGTLGIVTIEDILEELVGEIWDEDDVIEENITQVSDHVWSVDAEEHVSDFFEEIGFEDPQEEEHEKLLMGTWALNQFPSIPVEGQSFEYQNLTVEAERMDHNRILRLKVMENVPEKEGEK